MEVRIIKSKKSSYWYSDRIGEIFTVEECGDIRRYELAPEGKSFIDKDDCVIFPNESLIGIRATGYYVKVVGEEFTYYIDSNCVCGWMQDRIEGQRSSRTNTLWSTVVISNNSDKIIVKNKISTDELLSGVLANPLFTITLGKGEK